MKLNMKEKKILYAYACPSHHNTVTRLKWLTALTVDPEAKSQMLHLARKIETETEERWYEAFYHHLRMEMDEYRRIRRSLRALKANTDYEEELYEEAALVYGISVGRNGMACCPFHDDRHPSMKVDRRFHCFACQADGDVIDFTSRLFGLSSKEAALKLAEDFSISFDRKGHDPPQKRVIKRKISEEMRYRQAEQKCFRVLCDYLRLLERWKEEYAPKQPEDDWNPLFVEALHRQPYIEYLLDLLLSDSIEERAFVVAEYGKEVRKIEQRISEFIASHPAGCDERSRSHSAGTER